MLCSELADVEDDDEFDQLLAFVLAQWRNVRQHKRVRVGAQGGDECELDAAHGGNGDHNLPRDGVPGITDDVVSAIDSGGLCGDESGYRFVNTQDPDEERQRGRSVAD